MGYEIDFLAVGNDGKSGDAIAMRYGNLFGDRQEQRVIVIDGGFEETGERLTEHIRQYYHTDSVDLVISTHPDMDHSSGLKVVLDRLRVARLWMHQPWEHTEDIARMFNHGRVTDASVRERLRRSLEDALELEQLAIAKRIPIDEPFTGMHDDSGGVTVVGPTLGYYESLLPHFRCTPVPRQETLMRRAFAQAIEVLGRVVESFDIETLTDSGETSAENNSSTILLFQWDGHRVLFTADAGMPALTWAADVLDSAGIHYSSLKLVQVPHHGSKRNVGPTILDRLLGPKRPVDLGERIAYVSASKKGAPKHPAKKVTNAFRRRGAPVWATCGKAIWYHHAAPDRAAWMPIEPLPMYAEVEE